MYYRNEIPRLHQGSCAGLVVVVMVSLDCLVACC
jgi:hypothetical protein